MNKDWITLILIAIAVAVLIAVYFEIRKEGTACAINPLVYGAKMQSNAGREFYCSCYYNVPNSPVIFVTKDNITVMEK